jgi:peptidoglycan hydrolase-like protein with peptidoglycan-binding domain
VRQWSANLFHARHTLFVVDACFSGLVGFEPKGDEQGQTLDRLRRPAHHLITGGDEGEQTYAADARSLFTDAFLRAAGGEGDLTGDGLVSINELMVEVGKLIDQRRNELQDRIKMTPRAWLARTDDNSGEFFFIAKARREQAQVEARVAASDVEGKGMGVQAFDARALDLAFWESIRASRKVSDFEAYLRGFPNGIYTELARSRLEDLRAGVAESAASAPTDRSPAEDEADLGLGTEDWRRIQEALTALGFDIRGRGGNPDADTRSAVAAWQKSRRLEDTGYLSGQQFDEILGQARWKSDVQAAALEPATPDALSPSPAGAPPRSPMAAGPTPLTPSATAALPAVPPSEPTQPTAEAPPPDNTELVRRLQTALRELGHYTGPSNGRLGPLTRAAVDSFAAASGLRAGAEPDEDLVANAEALARERRVQAAEAQRALNRRAQQSLADLGYEIGDIDGIFGSRSRQALADWLRGRGRPPIGGEVDEPLVASLEAAVVGGRATPATAPVASQPKVETTVARLEQEGGDAVIRATSPVPQQPATPNVTELAPAVAAGERRVALVIGNSAYRNVEPLKNPRQDAGDMAKALADIGFEVLQGFDLDRDAMDELTSEFARRAERADLALAYYSGHGLQFAGTNYLVPVDGRIEDRRDLRRLVRLDQLIEDTSRAGELGMVIIDASRNDPSVGALTVNLRRSLGGSRSTELGAGLARPGVVPPQTLIAYATASGSVAYDGEGRNSPYVAALLRHLKTPGVEVRRLLSQVRDEIERETGSAQRPEVYASLGGEEIFLVPGAAEPTGLELGQLTPGEVRAIQRSLGWLGFWPGPADGEASPGLVDAVRGWQGSQYAEATGRLTAAEIVALHRRALRDRPREPLPTIDVDALLQRLDEAEAQRLLGMVYDPAFEVVGGFAKDRDKSKDWYAKAAAQGDPVAAGRLGVMLAAPGSPAADHQEARRWLEAAARAGEPQAALRLAELLLDDQADAAGRSRAVELLKVAAAGPETNGLANAFLRDAGAPVVR